MASHTARRVLQTPKTFTNWRPVLVDMAREKFGKGPETLSFAARSGLRIDCPNQPGARVPIYEIFAEDCYHFEWFLGTLAEGPIQVMDIGGQVGTFACRLAQVQPKATIAAFEPSPTTADFLRRNVSQNHFDDRITVHEQALAGSIGFAEFDDNGGGSGTNSLVATGGNAATAASEARNIMRVETTTFDAAVAAIRAPIDLVKMDCEGGEYDMVYASSPENWSSVHRLVLEYHPVEGQSWDELRNWFGRVGLTVQHEEPANVGLGVAWLSREPLGTLVG
ncbi:MAG TPA: FkbM family methyltransferase [Acidimicrobiales bacterium]|jgi:FkbM family methyltransferase|nr:FkbM family methyltransferase [Acidimicrobiales bacterium]